MSLDPLDCVCHCIIVCCMNEVLAIVASTLAFTNSQSNLFQGVGIFISIQVVLVVWRMMLYEESGSGESLMLKVKSLTRQWLCGNDFIFYFCSIFTKSVFGNVKCANGRSQHLNTSGGTWNDEALRRCYKSVLR